MGPGMMGGYYGTGRDYGRRYPPTGKAAIDAQEAVAMMNDYLKS
jgi:hypothetical protein